MKIVLQISGKPVGKGRPRFVPNTGRAYTPRETTLAENEIRRAWEEAGRHRFPDDASLFLIVTLYVERPKGHFRTDGSLNPTGQRMPHPNNKKPDLDNAVKLIMDALEGRAYKNDVQVVELNCSRYWSPTGYTSVSVGEISDDDSEYERQHG